MNRAIVLLAIAGFVPPWCAATHAQAADQQGESKVQVVRYSGKKITQRSAQLLSIADLPSSDPVSWSAQLQSEGTVTIAVGQGTGCEQVTGYELTLADKKGDLPQLVDFRRIVAGNHGGGDEDYACVYALVDGTIAIDDWNPKKGGIVSGTVRGTLKPASASGKNPPVESEPQEIALTFWARI